MLPVQRTLTFRIDACSESSMLKESKWLKRGIDAACIHDESVTKLRTKLARRFKMKIEGAWISATLDDSLKPLLDYMKELTREGTARFGSGLMTESLTYSDQYEWYRVQPLLELNNRNRKVGKTELLRSFQPYASDQFRSAVEQQNLRGVFFGSPDLEPIRGDTRTWFPCLAGALTGRGLDHEWAPPNEPRVNEGNGRIGSNSASNETAVVNRLDPMVAEICTLFPPGKLQLNSFPRLWADSLPDTDFAGLAWITGAGEWRVDSIIVRRSAANTLMSMGMIETEVLEPIEVVKSRDARIAILDEEVGPLPPSLIAMVRARSSFPWSDRSSGHSSELAEIPRQLAIPQLDFDADRVALSDIRAAAQMLDVVVPRVWEQLLSKIGRIYLYDMIPSHPSSWAEDQPDHEDLRAGDNSLPLRMLMVGSTLNGDWFSLDLDHVTAEGDCPLLKFDH